MTRIILGLNEQEVQQKAQSSGLIVEALRSAGLLIGTAPEIREQLERLSSVGV